MTAGGSATSPVTATEGWVVESSGPVATVRFSRPPEHRVRLVDLRALGVLLTELAVDDTVSVVVLTGEGPGAFPGPADLDDLAPLRSGADGRPFLEQWETTLTALEDLPQPVVAAVDGPARGGGCEMTLAATFRLAGPSASFGQMEILRGAMPGAGATQRLPRLVGAARAASMVLTGRTVDADEAERIGLVEQRFTADAGERMHEWAQELAERPRAALIAAKAALIAATRPSLAGLRIEQDHFLDLIRRTTTGAM